MQPRTCFAQIALATSKAAARAQAIPFVGVEAQTTTARLRVEQARKMIEEDLDRERVRFSSIIDQQVS
jgi:hypothetical protein